MSGFAHGWEASLGCRFCEIARFSVSRGDLLDQRAERINLIQLQNRWQQWCSETLQRCYSVVRHCTGRYPVGLGSQPRGVGVVYYVDKIVKYVPACLCAVCRDDHVSDCK